MNSAAAAALQGWHVMVVGGSRDDRACSRGLLLEGSGRPCRITEADTAVAGVRALLDDAPDCALVACDLPDMSATEMLRALAGPDGLTVCPVVVTSCPGTGPGRAVLRAGAQDYVGADRLSPERFARVVETAVERWTLARALRSRTSRDTLRSALAEALRLVAEPAAAKFAAACVLGRHLKANRVVYGAVGPDGYVTVEPGYVDGVADIPGRYRLDDFGPVLLREYGAGRPVTAADVPSDPMFSDAERSRYRDIGVVANLGVPLMKEGRLSGVLSVHQSSPRRWTADEVALVTETAEATWAAVRLSQTEADLRANEERLRLALEASATGLWTWDVEGDVITWSPECYQIHGMSPGGFAGTEAAFLDLVHPDDRARVRAAFRAAPESLTLYECEYRIVRPGGEVRRVTNRARADRDAGDIRRRMLGTITDMTERREAADLNRRNRDTFFGLLENAPFGVYIVDADFRLRQVSAGAKKAFANVPPPLLGRDFGEVMRVLWPDPFASDVIARFRHTLRTGEPYVAPRTVERRADLAEEQAYDWRIERLELPDGRPAVACYYYDLTDQNRLEAAVRRSESFYRQTLESIPGMVFTNAADGECDYVSEQWVAYTGIPASEHLGSGWVDVIHPDDRARAYASWQAAVAGCGAYDLEYRVRRHDGDYGWFKARGRAIRDGDGTIVRWFGMAVDIDDLKRAEGDLKARERELQTLADNTPDILTRYDREFRYLFVNAAVEKATGRKRQEFIGKTNRELGMPPELCDRWENAIRTVFESGRHRSLEFDLPGVEGLRHYAARLVPERGPAGTVEYVLGVAHDLTERKEFEQTLAEQDKRKDEFLATLAHELRNPLAPLRNGLQILRLSGGPGGSAAAAREMMERQLDHLVHLVDDLLDISRVSQGKITLKRDLLTVREAVEAAVEACRPTIGDKGHVLTVDLSDEPIRVEADRTRLVQVVANLLTNAAKYTEPGGRISVLARADGDEAIISVTDSGVGIPPELLPTLWDMFTQVRDTLDKAQGGLGIGLSIVKKVVEMHGGTVAVESRGSGFGSTFTVRLPLAPGDRSSHVAGGDVGGGADQTPVARRVLVVDDNVDGAGSFCTMLDLLGHHAAAVHDGAAAVAAVLKNRPEFVFLDIGLPGMDGYDVARRLRADPSTAGTTLVALTGWGSEDDKRKSRAAGFDFHLTKPVDLEAVERVLAGKGVAETKRGHP